MTTKLAAVLAEEFTRAELTELREALIAAWVIPNSGGRFDPDSPIAGQYLFEAVADAESRAGR
jgi:hypothetical protein